MVLHWRLNLFTLWVRSALSENCHFIVQCSCLWCRLVGLRWLQCYCAAPRMRDSEVTVRLGHSLTIYDVGVLLYDDVGCAYTCYCATC